MSTTRVAPARRRWSLLMLALLVCAAGACSGSVPATSDAKPGLAASPSNGPSSAAVPMPFSDARPVIEAHRQDLPKDLAGPSDADIEARWPTWLAEHNAAIRGRLARGDDDSVVNLWLYGTSFTTRPRATTRELTRLDETARLDVVGGRLDDLLTAMTNPSGNERIAFARRVVLRQGFDLGSPQGRDKAWDFLDAARTRMVQENDTFRREATTAATTARGDSALAAFARLFRNRGLSSDTSITIAYALDRTIAEFAASPQATPGGIHRLGIVGPGLDFTDKSDGYDFYPLQTIQPFGLVDSIARSGLGAGDLSVVTFDLSDRVNQHLIRARERAAAAESYVLHLPLERDTRDHQWQPGLATFWQRFGDRIGDDTTPVAPPASAGDVRVRAVRVRPEIVRSITARDQNIVLEQSPSASTEAFDLIVATNVLLYYDAFEQALAVSNIAKMLRPGGFLLTNYQLAPQPPMTPTATLATRVDWDKQGKQDTLFWYQRR